MRTRLTLVFVALIATLIAADQKAPTGYTDTPYLPGGKWRVHDDARPRPRVVTPGTFPTDEAPGKPPSDAIVLFDGKDLSQWQMWDGPVGADFYPKHDAGKTGPPTWKVHDGYIEVIKNGHLMTKQKFGDVQLHVEWAAPNPPVGDSQGRGNSGIIFFGTYEVQVLDSYNNKTYADGQAAAVYGQYPPLVNASRPPGEWQTYDIVFEAPRFRYGKLVKPAYVTVFHNGVLVQLRQEYLGPMQHRARAPYQPHEAEGPLVLQMHTNPVRYRSVWVRKLDEVRPTYAE